MRSPTPQDSSHGVYRRALYRSSAHMHLSTSSQAQHTALRQLFPSVAEMQEAFPDPVVAQRRWVFDMAAAWMPSHVMSCHSACYRNAFVSEVTSMQARDIGQVWMDVDVVAVT